MGQSDSKQRSIIAITKNGIKNAIKLKRQINGTLYFPEKFKELDELSDEEVEFFEASSKEVIKRVFPISKQIVWFGALGVLIRFIAPLLVDKKTDPAVISIDEQGKFVISVVSGHLGGANECTNLAAHILGSIPVITTASDVSGTIAVDLLGKEFGWEIDCFENVTKVSASVVNGEKVAVVQSCGEKNWWNKEKLPENINVFSDLEGAINHKSDALLLITHEILKFDNEFLNKTVIYRPKVLSVGVGCNRKTPLTEVEEAIFTTLEENGLSFKSVKNLATIDKKNDEKAFLEFSEKYSMPFNFYEAKELNRMDVPNPSEYSLKYVGAKGVAEPAAMLGAEVGSLIVEKRKFKNVTVAVAFRLFEN